MPAPYIVGIGGPSGSGKTSITKYIISELGSKNVAWLPMDNFYKPLNETECQQAQNHELNLDTPDAIDLAHVCACLKELKNGHSVEIPVYSFALYNRVPNTTQTVCSANIIVLDGLYALYDPGVLDLLDLKVYVDVDLDVCLARRLLRDIVHRGKDIDTCMHQWITWTRCDVEKNVKPTLHRADIVVPNCDHSKDATIQMIVGHLKSVLGVELGGEGAE
ncbi:hypothetical protein ACO0QE_003739 [Hanseniaspora vineae]